MAFFGGTPYCYFNEIGAWLNNGNSGALGAGLRNFFVPRTLPQTLTASPSVRIYLSPTGSILRHEFFPLVPALDSLHRDSVLKKPLSGFLKSPYRSANTHIRPHSWPFTY